MEVSLDVVANIRKSDIKGDVPDGAEYAMLSPRGGYINKFYKFIEVKSVDGIKDVLHYWGEQGGWHPSHFNSEPHKLSAEIFLKVV